MAKRNEGGKKRARIDLLGRAADLPGGVLDAGAHITLLSNREAVVDGCRAIIEYCEDRVKLNVGRGSVSFSGRDLEIHSLDEKNLVIRGFLLAVEFCM